MSDFDPSLINTDLVEQLVAQQFPEWAGLPVQQVLPGGWDNRTFRLGDDLSIRLPSAVWYEPQVRKEQRWLPILNSGLSIDIPSPIAMGQPASDFPFVWSIGRWIEGAPLQEVQIENQFQLADDIANFLKELHHISTEDGPAAGPQNFHRGGDLTVYDAEVMQSLKNLSNQFDVNTLNLIWNRALSSKWQMPPVWVHGDMSVGNLLVREGKLAAAIDFGSCGIGDPACDLVMAWTYFDEENRNRFVESIGLDVQTWERAAGWALWKAAITVLDDQKSSEERDVSAKVLRELLNSASE